MRRIVVAGLLASLCACSSPDDAPRPVEVVDASTPVPDAEPLPSTQEPMDSIEDDGNYLDENEVVPDERVVMTDTL